jgi:hypothetical protein
VAVVEAAVAAPLVLVALLGVVESALAWRDQVALVDATTEAARAAALHPSTITGWTPMPSMFSGITGMVSAVTDGLGTTRSADVERLVVFAPTGPAGRPAIDQMPESCRLSAQVTAMDRCVVIEPHVLAGGEIPPEVLCAGGDCPWRQPAIDGTTPGYVGVYVRMRRQWIVPGLGAGEVSEAAALAPVEGGIRAAR